MAAPVYHDEFDDRMQSMAGYVKTSVDSARYEINRNTDAKFAAVIKHYDEQIALLMRQNEEQRKEIEALKADGDRRERKLDAILKAMNVNIDEI